MSDQPADPRKDLLEQRRKALRKILRGLYVVPVITTLSREALAQGRPRPSRPLAMMMGMM